MKKKIVYLGLGALFFFTTNLSASMVADRSANPTYIRTPKIYELPHASPSQHMPSMPAAPTHSQMIIRPIVQPTQIEPHVEAHTTREIEEEKLRAYQAAQERPVTPAEIQATQARAKTPAEVQAEIQAARVKEIESYTHMHGTSDTYGGIELK